MKTVLFSSVIRWMTVLIAALTLLTIASCGGGNGDSAVAVVADDNRLAADNAFTATLTGTQEIPPNGSAALGVGTAIVDTNTRLLKATVTTAGIVGTAVSIYDSPTGVSGPIVFSLSEISPGIGIWTVQTILTDAQFGALQAGNYYFNVLSAANPGGEIRGQILPRLSTSPGTGATGAGTTAADTAIATGFRNALTGMQQVPPASTTATAIGTATVDHVAKTLTVAVNTIGIAGTQAHIHEAPPGLNGPTVFTLSQTSGGGIWFAKVSLSDSQLNSLMAGNFYFDVHSAAFPDGEIRGQIAQLHKRARIKDCRFGGFGFDDCTFDGVGFFVGFGFSGFDGFDGFIVSDFDGNGFDGNGFNGNGFGMNDFGTGSPSFNGFDSGNGGMGDFTTGGGAFGSDTPAPGFFF